MRVLDLFQVDENTHWNDIINDLEIIVNQFIHIVAYVVEYLFIWMQATNVSFDTINFRDRYILGARNKSTKLRLSMKRTV